MRAIILAAGRGSRLADQNSESLPKCLLEFGGRTLLQRHLQQLFRCSVVQTDLVVGYEADRIIEHVGRLTERSAVAFHFNPRFEQGSVLSLLAARDTLEYGGEVLLMDADVLYHPEILVRLFNSMHDNCFLLDREFAAGDEPVKIAIRNGFMVDFRKRLPDGLDYDTVGESVGFFRFAAGTAAALAVECARYEAEGMSDAPHEEILRSVLLRRPDDFGFEDVTGLPWIEIDFSEDVRQARERVLPAIRAEFPDY